MHMGDPREVKISAVNLVPSVVKRNPVRREESELLLMLGLGRLTTASVCACHPSSLDHHDQMIFTPASSAFFLGPVLGEG